MIKTPSPSYSIIIRLEIVSKPGMLGKVTSTIGRAGGDIGAIDIVGFKKNVTIRDIIVSVADIPMGEKVVEELRRIKGVNVLQVTDRTFMVHQGGKIEIKNKIPLNSREDLSMAYTPGVARICMAIHEKRERVYDLTIKNYDVVFSRQNLCNQVTPSRNGKTADSIKKNAERRRRVVFYFRLISSPELVD